MEETTHRIGSHLFGITPSAANAILGRELRSYAHLVHSGIPGRGRKAATLRWLAEVAGREAEVERCLKALGESRILRAAPDRRA